MEWQTAYECTYQIPEAERQAETATADDPLAKQSCTNNMAHHDSIMENTQRQTTWMGQRKPRQRMM
jgi:hypothetical protein